MNAPVWQCHARISTRSGRVLDLLNPNPDAVDLDDVALGLARRARWSGQTRSFLSVAEHSVAVGARAEQLAGLRCLAPVLRAAARLGGVLHDASEAYYPDVPGPLKPFLLVRFEDGTSVSFAELEERLLRGIRERFGLTEELWDVVRPLVKQADREVLRIEAEAEMHGVSHWQMPPPVAAGFPWVPQAVGPDEAVSLWRDEAEAALQIFELRRRQVVGVVRAPRKKAGAA